MKNKSRILLHGVQKVSRHASIKSQNHQILQKLGKRLTELLDEDQWAECEEMLRAAGVTHNIEAALEVEILGLKSLLQEIFNTVSMNSNSSLCQRIIEALDEKN